MDGSRTVLGNRVELEAIPYSNSSLRIICYGEALRALADHVSNQFLTGPYAPMVNLLEDAYDRFTKSRVTCAPEEFTIFVMSLLLDLCEDAEEAMALRQGAARYILKVAPNLPDDYAGIITSARKLLPPSAPLSPPGEYGPTQNAKQHDNEVRLEAGYKSAWNYQPLHAFKPPSKARLPRIHFQRLPTQDQRAPDNVLPNPYARTREAMPEAREPSGRQSPQDRNVFKSKFGLLLFAAIYVYVILAAFGLVEISPRPVIVSQ